MVQIAIEGNPCHLRPCCVGPTGCPFAKLKGKEMRKDMCSLGIYKTCKGRKQY